MSGSDNTQSLDDIIDLGALGSEPSEAYLEGLDMLDNIARECILVSRSYGGVASPTGAHFYASLLFTQMITKCVSLLTLAPHSPWADKKIEHWDYSSMTGIARTMIELRISFFYLCVDPCAEDEWLFRWNLFNLHDCVSQIRMFDALENVDQVTELSTAADEFRERLRTSPFFEAIDPKARKKLLHGQSAYLFPLEVMAEKAGIDLKLFRWLYVLFSSHVHALPMSFYRMGQHGDDRGRGLPSPSEENYSALCLSLTATLIVATRDDIHLLFKGCEQEKAVSEPDVEELIINSPGLAIGECHVQEASETLSMRFAHISEGLYSTTLIYRPTGDEILEREDSQASGADLKYFDPYFWSVELNGQSATEKALEQALCCPHASRVDYSSRKILFKTEV